MLTSIPNLLSQVITVRDRVTHQPIEFATVIVISKQELFITDAKGRADLKHIPAANDSIHVRYVGYQRVALTWAQIEAIGFHVLLQATQVGLEEVVISSARWEKPRSDVTNKVATIRPMSIALNNPQTAADMLGNSGQLLIQKSQQGGGSPMIRGFATNRVLMVVDGVRMNNAIFRSGNLQNVIALDANAMERAEILFGPGSVMYGSDAIGGVMAFYTRKPRLSVNDKPLVKANAMTRFASANMEKTGHMDFNIGLKKLAFLTSFTYSAFDDLRMGANGPDDYLRPEYVARINGEDSVLLNPDPLVQMPSGYSQYNVMQKVRYAPRSDLNIIYGFHYSASSDVPRYDRLLEYRNNKPRDGDWYYGPQTWMMNTLAISRKDSARLYDAVNVVIAQQQFGESRHTRTFGSTLITHRQEIVDAYSANLDLQKNMSGRSVALYGAEWVLNQVHSIAKREDISTGVTAPASTRYPNGSNWNAYALYGGYRHAITLGFTMQFGIRYSVISLYAPFDTTFFPFPFSEASLTTGAFSGSTGFAWKPRGDLQINLNLSQGFRAPNIDDIGKLFDSEPGYVIVPNPDLSPEYAYNADAVVTKTFGEVLKIEVAGYYTLLDNALVRRDFQLDGRDSMMYDGTMSRVQAILNAAQATVYGLQASVEIEFLKSFGFSTRFNYQVGEEELDDGSTAPLRHAGPWFGSSGLSYSRDRFTSTFYAIGNGSVPFDKLAPSEQVKSFIYAKDADGNPYSLSWYTLNLKVLYQVTDFFAVSLGIENMTDQCYRPYSSGITASGRSAIASLRGTF